MINLAIEADSGYVDAYTSKATTYFYSGFPDSMHYYSKKALKFDPDHALANNRMARYHQMYGDRDLAVKYYLRSLNNHPNSVNTHLFLGQVYCEQEKNIAKGYPHLLKAMDLIGEKSISSDLPATLASIGNYDLALKYFKRYYKRSNSCRRLGLIELYIDRRNYEQALKLLDSAYQNFDCNLDGYNLTLYAYQGQYDQALKFISNWKWAEDTSWLHRKYFFSTPLIGYVYEKLGQKQKADQYFKLCIKNNQYFAEKNKYQSEPDFNLARIYAWQNRKYEAIRSIRNMVRKKLSIRFFDVMEYDPMFDPLRDDPEFIMLMEEARLRKEKVQEEIRKVEKTRSVIIN